VIQALIGLLQASEREVRRRLLLLVGCGVLAAWAGFVAIDPSTAERLIASLGYYYIFALFSLFIVFAWRVAAPRRSSWIGWFRPRWPVLVLALAGVCAIWIDPLKHKVLFDEYVLQGTAYHMHASKEIGTVVRAHEIFGTWVPIDIFLDKRPYFFTFLVSLVHDFTGYRSANMFAVNIVMAPLFLALVYWLGLTSTERRGPAFLAVGLLTTMPLLGQQVTGAGMELHNLTVLALVMAIAVLYLRAPDADRLALLILGTVLLSQCRYESVIFVLPVALIVVAGWRRLNRVLLPWPVIIAPLLLVPYAWHNRVLSAKPMLWQLREGETSRFSTTYLGGNLEGARKFFFNTGVELANSWWLSVVGVVAVLWLLGAAYRWARNPDRRRLSPAEVVILLFGFGIAGNLAMLMFYYWSRLDEVIASRFALPLYFLLALLAARLGRDLDARRIPGTRLAAFGLAIWFVVFALPAVARRPYTDQNLVMLEVEWARDIVKTRTGPVLFVTNSSTIPFVLMRIPTVLVGTARHRGQQIRYHLSQGTFREVLVAQAIRPVSASGLTGVDPEDRLPASFHLEQIAQKRFGGRWLRISRVVEIEEAAATPATATATEKAASPPRENNVL
jgi:hypothetical protein